MAELNDTELNVMWEALNTVYFTDEKGIDAHRKLLMKYRRQVAKQLHGGAIDAADVECGTLEHYNDLRAKRKKAVADSAMQKIKEQAELDYLQKTLGKIG
jgi:oligoribonuclease (3'-5' exoribonuclease)